jgi:hypothetical protein
MPTGIREQADGDAGPNPALERSPAPGSIAASATVLHRAPRHAPAVLGAAARFEESRQIRPAGAVDLMEGQAIE